jgi:hypothetical protein
MQNRFDQFDNPPHPLGPQPQPWPGAVTGPTIQSPRLRSLDQSDVRVGIDQEQNTRAWESLQMERERLARDQEKWARERRTSEGNSNVDTTASQDQAAGHVAMLRNSLATLKDVGSKAPDALKPTLKEFGTRWLLTEDPEALGFLQTEQRQRAFNAYNSIADSAIWLMTGAAAPEQQDKRIRWSLTPGVNDEPGVVADKQRTLLAYIAQARARAGAGELKLDGKTPFTQSDLEGLKFLEDQAQELYGTPVRKGSKPTLDDGSGTTSARMIPPEMQQEHNSFIASIPRGKLTLGQYIDFYGPLNEKYGINGQIDLEKAKEFVDGYNSGRDISEIPLPVEEKGTMEQLLGGVASSEVGTGAKNFASAMTLGAPELLGGAEGRAASELADQENPNAALLGEVLGSVMPGVGLEKSAAKFIQKLGAGPGSRAARVGGDMLGNAIYGGVTELNQTGDVDEAAVNALMGAGGAGAARGVAKGFAEFKPETYRQGLKDLGPQDILDDAGNKVGQTSATNLTTAQRLGSPGTDEFIEGFPGISGTRQAAVGSMNKHNSERVLAKVGLKLPGNLQPGQQMNEYVSKTLGEEYNKLAPAIKGNIDAPFTNAVAGLRNSILPPARRGFTPDPEIKKLWQPLENAINKFASGGKFDFNSYKKFTQDVREWQKYYATAQTGPEGVPSPTMNEMGRNAEKLITQARALVSRANPDAGARLKKIDNAYAHQMRIEMASRGPAKQERGVYAPQEYLNAVERMDTSKGKSATARGTAFEQPYGQSAMEVMGQKPSKGGSPLASTAIGFGVGTAVLPVTAALYAPGIKKLTQALSDGRLGKKLDKLTPAQIQKQFPELPTDVIKQIMATYIRERTVGN